MVQWNRLSPKACFLLRVIVPWKIDNDFEGCCAVCFIAISGRGFSFFSVEFHFYGIVLRKDFVFHGSLFLPSVEDKGSLVVFSFTTFAALETTRCLETWCQSRVPRFFEKMIGLRLNPDSGCVHQRFSAHSMFVLELWKHACIHMCRPSFSVSYFADAYDSSDSNLARNIRIKQS